MAEPRVVNKAVNRLKAIQCDRLAKVKRRHSDGSGLLQIAGFRPRCSKGAADDSMGQALHHSMRSLYVRISAAMWGKADELRFSVLMGLRKGLSLVRMRRALTDDEQHKIAAAIVEHLKTTSGRSSKGRRAKGMGRI
jgi:hypothetical protein